MRATTIALMVAMGLVAAGAGCGKEVSDGGGAGADAGGTNAGAGRSASSGGRVDSGAGGGQPDGGTRFDGGTDGSALSPCSSGIPCAFGELPVRVVMPALGDLACACVQNPCDSGFPTCDCAEPVCASFNATCTGYMPGSGYLVCTEPG